VLIEDLREIEKKYGVGGTNGTFSYAGNYLSFE
jgi:hypothetical protein